MASWLGCQHTGLHVRFALIAGAEIDRLVADKDLAQLCPYYVDLQVEGPRLQAIVNKMKSISSTLTLVTTKHGHLHLQVAAEQVGSRLLLT